MPAPSPESSRHLLVPFAAASAPECQALLESLILPNLKFLLARLNEVSADRGEEHDFSPPHERALARALGLPAADGRIPWAAAQSDAPATPQAFFSLCHFQVGMDQVTLLPGAQLGLEETESRTLFEAFAPLCAEDGVTLRWEGPGEWHASGEPLRGLDCASLDRVSGRNASDWMPRPANDDTAPAARLLQRLQSEAQMLFYSHPTHDARSARGQLPVNGFWVHGAGAL
ncbi:MAG: phosphoglycerate mutase, partial [Hydrogenophaga sp.]|nr:phosphoglycerate mutase [Hydrogenophaga sp.]